MRAGFIGLGTMGASMALNLQAGEHEVAVNDLRRAAAAPHLKAGATWADGPREIAAHSEVIFTSLPGPREVEAVADILIEHMKPGTAWFDLSTNSPTVIRKLHARFAAKNIALLDAPVSGGPSGAKTRKLALLVGGDKAVFDKFKPALDAIGDQVIYIGPIGAGSVPSSCTTWPAIQSRPRSPKYLRWESRRASSRLRYGRRCASAHWGVSVRSTGWANSSCAANSIRRILR